jgi:hypothetical protein
MRILFEIDFISISETNTYLHLLSWYFGKKGVPYKCIVFDDLSHKFRHEKTPGADRENTTHLIRIVQN